MKAVIYFISAVLLMAISLTSVAGDVIVTVDNRDSSVDREGVWSTSTGLSPFGNDSEYNYAGGSFTWTASLPFNGEYELQAYWSSHPTRTESAVYEFVHNNGDGSVSANQSVNSGRWVTLGTYEFSEGTNSVTLKNAASGSLSADAIRFVGDSNLSKTVSYFEPALDSLTGRADVQNYDTGEIYVFYGSSLLFVNTTEKKLRSSDAVVSSYDPRTPPNNREAYLAKKRLYEIDSVNIVKNDDGELLVTWIERNAVGGQLSGQHVVVGYKIDPVSGTTVSRSKEFFAIRAQIQSVEFAVDGTSTIEFIDSVSPAPVTLDFN